MPSSSTTEQPSNHSKRCGVVYSHVGYEYDGNFFRSCDCCRSLRKSEAFEHSLRTLLCRRIITCAWGRLNAAADDASPAVF